MCIGYLRVDPKLLLQPGPSPGPIGRLLVNFQAHPAQIPSGTGMKYPVQATRHSKMIFITVDMHVILFSVAELCVKALLCLNKIILDAD